MLKKDEVKVLKILFEDFTKNYTIHEISGQLGQKYAQTHRTVSSLKHSGNIEIERIGNSKVLKLDFTQINLNYLLIESEMLKDRLNNKTLKLIYERILNSYENIICILFGSQTKQPSSKSDFDLLFIIPPPADISYFEKKMKNQLSPYNCDINIVTERGLLEMWSNPKKLNVGNEILKSHVVLYGAEHFLNLLRKYYKGEE